jgi:hypothetical protein
MDTVLSGFRMFTGDVYDIDCMDYLFIKPCYCRKAEGEDEYRIHPPVAQVLFEEDGIDNIFTVLYDSLPESAHAKLAETQQTLNMCIPTLFWDKDDWHMATTRDRTEMARLHLEQHDFLKYLYSDEFDPSQLKFTPEAVLHTPSPRDEDPPGTSDHSPDAPPDAGIESLDAAFEKLHLPTPPDALLPDAPEPPLPVQPDQTQ